MKSLEFRPIEKCGGQGFLVQVQGHLANQQQTINFADLSCLRQYHFRASGLLVLQLFHPVTIFFFCLFCDLYQLLWLCMALGTHPFSCPSGAVSSLHVPVRSLLLHPVCPFSPTVLAHFSYLCNTRHLQRKSGMKQCMILWD